MAGIEDVFKGNVATGLVIGVGVAVLAPVLAPLVAAVAKPVAKSVIKAGIIFYEKGRETAAELGEVFEDLVAEARAEMQAAAPVSASMLPEDTAVRGEAAANEAAT